MSALIKIVFILYYFPVIIISSLLIFMPKFYFRHNSDNKFQIIKQ